jgi:hypothetical protein
MEPSHSDAARLAVRVCRLAHGIVVPSAVVHEEDGHQRALVLFILQTGGRHGRVWGACVSGAIRQVDNRTSSTRGMYTFKARQSVLCLSECFAAGSACTTCTTALQCAHACRHCGAGLSHQPDNCHRTQPAQHGFDWHTGRENCASVLLRSGTSCHASSKTSTAVPLEHTDDRPAAVAQVAVSSILSGPT